MDNNSVRKSATITGVWRTINHKGSPCVIVEDEDGRTFLLKAKEVWPGEQAVKKEGE